MADYFISSETAADDLLACAAFLAERIKSSDARGDAMNAIVPRYLAKGNVDLAAELANALDEPFSRDKLLLLVAGKCAEIDDDEYGMQLAEAIEDHGVQAQAFERIALTLTAKGNTARAFEIADGMAHPDLIYAGVAAYQAANGREAEAAETLDRIVFPSARVASLVQQAHAKIQAGDPDGALEPLEQAVAAAGEIEHSEEKIRDYCDIANLFVEVGKNDKAIATFELARTAAESLQNTHRDFFLVNCALGFLYAGDEDLADSTLDLVTDKTQMSSGLLGFSREYWKKEEKEEALDTLEESYEILRSQREAETRDSRARNSLFASIAAQFAGYGKTDRGIDIASENIDPNETMAAYSQIAQILTVQKEDELARQTIDLIDEDANRLFALIGVSDAKADLGEMDAAIAMLDEAASLSETIEQLGSRSNVLNGIATRFANHGRAEKAREVSMASLDIVTEIRDECTQATALAGLSDIYTQASLELLEKERDHIGLLVRKAGW